MGGEWVGGKLSVREARKHFLLTFPPCDLPKLRFFSISTQTQRRAEGGSSGNSRKHPYDAFLGPVDGKRSSWCLSRWQASQCMLLHLNHSSNPRQNYSQGGRGRTQGNSFPVFSLRSQRIVMIRLIFGATRRNISVNRR